MFGFPVNLQDSGVQKFTNDADNGFPKIQQREVFYSVKDGNWNDLNTWQTASGRVGKFPTASDDVYVRNIISTNLSLIQCKNLYILGTLKAANGFNVEIYAANVICQTGLIDCSLIANLLDIYVSENNSKIGINNYKSGIGVSNSTFGYIGIIEQSILELNYNRLKLQNSGVKKLISNIVIGNNLSIELSSYFDASFYDITINGTTLMVGGTTFAKTGTGNILFIGAVSGNTNAMLFTGNPNIEFRGGCSALSGISGTGTWSFTTNNQTFNANGFGTTLDCNVIIGTGVTLTVNPSAGFLYLNNTINGIDSTSKFLMGSTGVVYFNTLASVPSMTTGIFDFTTNVNTIGYTGNYTATIPSYFSTFHSLTISGTGIKSLGTNTTIIGSLLIFVGGTIDCSIYNLNVLGATTLPNGSNATFLKSGSGNITFNGFVTLGQLAPGFNFSGNPNVEFKGGMSMYQNTITTGTGEWKFSTNNQTITITSVNINLDCSVLISGAITLNLTQSSGATFVVNNTINGDNASSVLNIGNTAFQFSNILYYLPMAIGSFIITSGTILYLFNSSISLPYTSYGNLTIGGTGTKTLSGNTTIGGSLSLIIDSKTIFECSTFNLSISGTTFVRRDTTLSKNGVGNLLFIGILSAATSGAAANLNFSGNPNVEFRGGISIVNSGITTGTGTYTFSTNNQLIDTNAALIFNGNIVIGNNIFVSYNCSQGGFSSLTFNGTLNGSNASSIFRMGTGTGTPSINYKNATQPMVTGILDTFTNPNTWIYGLNNQDIKGLPTTSPKQVYRNLTLNGTGVKTLQGYCSVLNTYTLTAPATLANNGFTLTNP